MTWTTPNDLKDQVLRLWTQGRILAAGLQGEPLFPLRLRLRRPGPRDLGEQFDRVRTWIRTLEDGAKPRRGHGYEIAWEDVNNRQLGRNRVPAGILVPTRLDALSLAGKVEEAKRFDVLARATNNILPELSTWLVRKPLVALDHARDWSRILDVVMWFKLNPRSGIYLRQIDLAGIDTKFIEERKGLFAELLDQVLPADVIDTSSLGVKGFEARYGLRSKPGMIRFRILDLRHAIGGLTDLTVPIEQFAWLAHDMRRVFITENEVNFLAFPEVEDSLLMFGMGYAVGLLSSIDWLQDCEIHYWGDIDTHGFVMLDRMRSRFPAARSLLMDQKTLSVHQALWSVEHVPHGGQLDHLTEAERALYDDLRLHRFGRHVRLEQERVSFGWLQRALKTLPTSSA